MDNYDRNILNLIQSNASLSVEEVAEKVNLSRNACWRRIRNLEKSGIISGKVALVDPSSVGFGLCAFVLIKTYEHDKKWLQTFKRVTSSMPEIVGAHRMTGDIDYILKVRIRDMKAYDNFYQRLVSQIKISDVSACFVMEDLKDSTAIPV